MTAYYNEFDPFAAEWLRALIAAGHIADGVVDTRSIVDVVPADLAGFAQCHFFAGIGGWSRALRRAGVPDDRSIWTGSCPCQPFSAAGKGGGFDDERHLWPSWYWLIEQCRPARLVGEQVASAAAGPWLDLVQADLEALGYAFGAVPFPSAGLGAPHIRDRLYWLAHAGGAGLAFRSIQNVGPRTLRVEGPTSAEGVLSRGLADADGRHPGAERQQRGGEQRQQPQDGGAGWLADAGRDGGQPVGHDLGEAARGAESQARERERLRPEFTTSGDAGERPSPLHGFWRDADWLFCRDGKWRPVEPGTFPLAHGLPARVGRLRGYGNAINAEQAALFLEEADAAARHLRLIEAGGIFA